MERNATPLPMGQSAGVKSDIEGAARCGYLDAVAMRGHSAEYEMQEDKWQRNYEIGRLWVSSMRAAGIVPPEWPEDAVRPEGFQACLETMRRIVGDVVPRGEVLAADPAPLRARVPDLRHGRLIERVTS